MRPHTHTHTHTYVLGKTHSVWNEQVTPTIFNIGVMHCMKHHMKQTSQYCYTSNIHGIVSLGLYVWGVVAV